MGNSNGQFPQEAAGRRWFGCVAGTERRRRRARRPGAVRLLLTSPLAEKLKQKSWLADMSCDCTDETMTVRPPPAAGASGREEAPGGRGRGARMGNGKGEPIRPQHRARTVCTVLEDS